MTCGNVLEQLLKKGTIKSILKKGDAVVPEVMEFQKVLYELGFDIHLNPHTGKGNGIFDDEVVKALQSFCKKNNITSDGSEVNPEIASALIKRYESLPALVQLGKDLEAGKIGQKYFKGSSDKQAISVLQQLLNDLKPEGASNSKAANINGVFGAQTENDLKDFMKNQGIAIPDQGDSKSKKVPEKEEENQDESISGHIENMLKNLLHKGTIGSILKKTNVIKPEIKELKRILHQMGFGGALKQTFDKLDGKYDEGLVNAVKAFARKNNLASDGQQITHEIGSALLKRLRSLPALHELFNDVTDGKIGQKYFKGSKHKIAISALQKLLNDLGFGKELEWDKKKNDGIFDKSTAKALKAFLHKGLLQTANKLTPLDTYKIFDELGKHYGKNWMNEVKPFNGTADSVLTTFTDSNFQGDKVIADVEFVDSLKKINAYALKNKVQVDVTSSYRPTDIVKGAVVTPATHSNHMVGHAIDFNLLFKGGKANFDFFINNKDKEADWPAPVKGFINDLRNDPVLRWGGDFHDPDPIHIDDGLNQQPHMTKWKERYALTQEAWKNRDINQV